MYRKFALLCIELKYLYVAITRTKKRLIIYDEDNKSRVPIQRIWENLEVTDVLTKASQTASSIFNVRGSEHWQTLAGEASQLISAASNSTDLADLEDKVTECKKKVIELILKLNRDERASHLASPPPEHMY